MDRSESAPPRGNAHGRAAVSIGGLLVETSLIVVLGRQATGRFEEAPGADGDRPVVRERDGGPPRRCAAVSDEQVAQWCGGSSFARSIEARISASASSRPTHSAPSTDLPGSRSL